MPLLAPNPTTKITRAVRLAVFGVTLASLSGLALVPTQVSAQSQATYQISAGPLGSALTQFGIQAGVTISFDPKQTGHLNTAGLQGQYSIDEGLQRLLADSGLQAERQSNGGYVLVAASPETALELGRLKSPPTSWALLPKAPVLTRRATSPPPPAWCSSPGRRRNRLA